MRVVALALVALLGMGTAACGDDDSVSQDELQRATEEAAEEARAEAENEAKLDELREELRKLRKRQQRTEGRGDDTPEGANASSPTPDESGGVPADAEDCGGGVMARAGTTSCEFALNVAQAYFNASGNSEIEVYSPITDRTYRMSCTGGSPIVCAGGDDAAVYILVS